MLAIYCIVYKFRVVNKIIIPTLSYCFSQNTRKTATTNLIFLHNNTNKISILGNVVDHRLGTSIKPDLETIFMLWKGQAWERGM